MPYPREIALAKFRVAAVCICALAIMSVVAYLLTGGTLLSAKAALTVYIPDASGVAEKTPVRVDGVEIGKVDSVALTGSSDPNRIVRVAMTVETRFLRAIPVDSVAQVSADTMIGDKVVDITSGKQKQTIQPDGEIRFQPPADLMKSLDIAQFEQQLRKVDAALTDIEEERTPLGEFVAGEQMYISLVNRTAELQASIRRAVASTGQVGSLLYSDALYRQISAPLRKLDDTLAAMQAGQGTGGRLMRDTADYDKLRADIASLRRSLAELREPRGAAGEFLNTDAMWDSLNRAAASLIATVDRVNGGPLFATSEAYDNLNGFARELETALRDFRDNPKKYLRIQVF